MMSSTEIRDWPPWRLELGDVNKWMPPTYKDEIPHEAADLLEQVKRGLALAVATADVEFGGSHWARMLGRYAALALPRVGTVSSYPHRYQDLHYPLTNRDRFMFAQMLLELATIPGADISKANKISARGVHLLRYCKISSSLSCNPCLIFGIGKRSQSLT
jgi:hypothetical protein